VKVLVMKPSRPERAMTPADVFEAQRRVQEWTSEFILHCGL